MSDWTIVLNGTAFVGGDDAPDGLDPEIIMGCLSSPPDGMGIPGLRVEDATFLQADGVKHFSDWYEPRILTMDNVSVCADGCPGCPSVRAKIQTIARSWSRYCGDTEMVVYTDCHDPDAAVTGVERAAIGPYGVVGRPRVATHIWTGQGLKCAQYLLRFDSTNHRLYVLDADGTAGSGEQCADLVPAISEFCRTYPRCYPMCYDNDISVSGNGPQVVDNFGSECAYLSITLTGVLTTPTITNATTGEAITYSGTVAADCPVTIDTESGTATDCNGDDVTYLIEGDIHMVADVGENTIQMSSLGSGDTGGAAACFRPFVVSG